MANPPVAAPYPMSQGLPEETRIENRVRIAYDKRKDGHSGKYQHININKIAAPFSSPAYDMRDQKRRCQQKSVIFGGNGQSDSKPCNGVINTALIINKPCH